MKRTGSFDGDVVNDYRNRWRKVDRWRYHAVGGEAGGEGDGVLFGDMTS
jgi:hypothetical protein